MDISKKQWRSTGGQRKNESQTVQNNCLHLQIEPVEICEAAIACDSDESEICISSTIAEISQECVEKCETVKENVCENKMVQKCEDVSTTTCKMVQKCEKVPKVMI